MKGDSIMKLCPECGKIADYSFYFGAYICNQCRWKDNTPNRERLAKYHNLSENNSSIECRSEKKKLVNVN